MLIGSDVLRLEYHLTGAIDALRIPVKQIEQRSDRLWEHSCFEAFLGMADGSYVEVNIAPSSLWATYQFDSYRTGMQQSWVSVFPHREESCDFLSVIAYVDLRPMPSFPTHLALSAVIEEADGTKSYWALAHPPGAPDFHHPDCFQLTLPAPDAA